MSKKVEDKNKPSSVGALHPGGGGDSCGASVTQNYEERDANNPVLTREQVRALLAEGRDARKAFSLMDNRSASNEDDRLFRPDRDRKKVAE